MSTYTLSQADNMTKKSLVAIAAQYGCKSLVSIETDAKTIKGGKLGYRTAIVYMMPDMTICPASKAAGCHEPCLVSAGQAAVYKAIPRARKGRTDLFHSEPQVFIALLKRELDAFIRKAKRDGFIPVIRLNGTSDIDYTRLAVNDKGQHIFDHYNDIQFYDYSKKPSHARKAQTIANYSVTLSYSGYSSQYANATMKAAHKYGVNVAVVFDSKRLPAVWQGFEVVNGDESDLRFKDPAGVVVGLYAKGQAKKDTSGFVQSANIIAKG